MGPCGPRLALVPVGQRCPLQHPCPCILPVCVRLFLRAGFLASAASFRRSLLSSAVASDPSRAWKGVGPVSWVGCSC